MMRREKPEAPMYPRKPPPMRAARLEECRNENGRIVERYVEAIEDASQGDGKPSQRLINERMGL